MKKYVLQRCLWLIVVLLCVGFLIFTVMYFVPGKPADVLLTAEATAQEKFEFNQKLGVNDPYIVQLGRYMYNTFIKFDFGTSYVYRVPVLQELNNRVPRTLTLGTIAIIINAFIGIPLGVACAMHQNNPLDHLLMILAMAGISMPDFWLALMMILLFSVKLKWLPPFGIGSWQNWIMPVIACSVQGVAVNARQTRSAVLETIRADFVTTARAKGVPEHDVIYKHMLPNALIPVINMLGGAFGRAIAGTVVIETVFSFPGVGVYMMNGINGRDYPVVRGCVLVLAAFSAVAVLIVDLIYGFIDPRIKAQYEGGGAHK